MGAGPLGRHASTSRDERHGVHAQGEPLANDRALFLVGNAKSNRLVRELEPDSPASRRDVVRRQSHRRRRTARGRAARRGLHPPEPAAADRYVVVSRGRPAGARGDRLASGSASRLRRRTTRRWPRAWPAAPQRRRGAGGGLLQGRLEPAAGPPRSLGARGAARRAERARRDGVSALSVASCRVIPLEDRGLHPATASSRWGSRSPRRPPRHPAGGSRSPPGRRVIPLGDRGLHAGHRVIPLEDRGLHAGHRVIPLEIRGSPRRPPRHPAGGSRSPGRLASFRWRNAVSTPATASSRWRIAVSRPADASSRWRIAVSPSDAAVFGWVVAASGRNAAASPLGVPVTRADDHSSRRSSAFLW